MSSNSMQAHTARISSASPSVPIIHVRGKYPSELSQADLVIAPDGLENFANYQLDKTEDIFSLGYFAALKAIEEQAELRNLKNYNKEILV